MAIRMPGFRAADMLHFHTSKHICSAGEDLAFIQDLGPHTPVKFTFV